MSHTYGIMQGRLAPPEDGRFQSFPRAAWREEFSRAAAAGLDYIEWIHDAYGEGKDKATGLVYNPIFTPEGLAEFDALKAEHNIATPALCGDWFMDVPLIRCSPAQRDRREKHLHELIPIAKRIGATKIVLPFVDNSKINGEYEKQAVLTILKRALPVAEKHGIELHLEADFGPEEFAAFMARLEHPMLKVNWDSGNSSGLGYIASEEFAAYGSRIGSVHIKDRYKKPEGGVETRPLGTGSANFDDVFTAIKSIDYQGGVTLQVARGADNDEVNFIKTQLEFVKKYW
jgi:L-ribulose-5-phosphate 3-epimerase